MPWLESNWFEVSLLAVGVLGWAAIWYRMAKMESRLTRVVALFGSHSHAKDGSVEFGAGALDALKSNGALPKVL